MPEAPIHEDASPRFPQHQVRMSRQSPMVQPIAEAPTPQPPPHNHFRLRILRFDSRHILVPLLGRKVVHKWSNSYSTEYNSACLRQAEKTKTTNHLLSLRIELYFWYHYMKEVLYNYTSTNHKNHKKEHRQIWLS